VSSFKIHRGSKEAELRAMKKGDLSLVVVIPADATKKAMTGSKIEVPVYYDPSKSVTTAALMSAVGEILNETERQITKRPQMFIMKSQSVQTIKLRNIDYLLPSILAMALMQLGLFGALRLVSLRERKILKRLGATPLPRFTLIAGEVTVRLMMAMIQTLLIVIIGRLVFNVHVLGSWLQVIGLVFLGAATFVSLGYALVSFAKTEDAGNGIIQLVQFPMMFLSGIFFPVSFMPGFLQPIMKALPLTYLGDALRQVMSAATPLYPLATDLLVMVAWLIVSMLLGIRFFQWE
jgi:ABC-2 type transport system permease protein